ncbi:hypothetical protein AB0D08_15920 [Kitasatospora sp. NPDC048540]|uniref:hypothetical protein n=1 Tax=unclassified Kitasatospora TaxID=2633591 RepID=UPI00053BAF34|nr:hypothetical protein [Kitasatospora sp. MBT63]
MNIVLVLELDVPTNVRLLGTDRSPADPQGPVRHAHAAPLDASGACGPLTLCGRDTGEMTLAPHRAPDPDQPWWPTQWHACHTCRTTRSSTAPVAVADTPTAADGPVDDDSSGDGDGPTAGRATRKT